MNRKQLISLIIIAVVSGALGGVIFDRVVIPKTARVKGLEWLAKYVSNSPIVITKREEVVLNEGANLIELAKQAATSTVSIYQKPDLVFLGNGIILTSDGLVFSTKSVVGNLTEVVVVTNDGAKFNGLVRALDPKSELVALTIEAQKLAVLPFFEASKMIPGQKILSVGQLNREFSRDFASGNVVRGVRDNKGFFEVFSSETLHETFLFDLPLNKGFVGSPILNLEGRLIGIVSSENGKVIIVENIQTALSSYLATGKIVRPRLGIKYIELSRVGASLRGFPRPGALAVEVEGNSPAGKAGIRVNDLIYEVEQRLVSETGLEQALNGHGIGQMKVKLLRGPQELELIINLEETK